MKKKDIIEESSEKLGKLFDLYPINLEDAAIKADREMKSGMAAAFSNTGYRKFMENCIRHANRSLIRSSSQEHMLYYKAQLEALMQVMYAGKTFFVDSELNRNKTEKERAAKVERAEKETQESHG